MPTPFNQMKQTPARGLRRPDRTTCGGALPRFAATEAQNL